jgi:hypothetical protein
MKIWNMKHDQKNKRKWKIKKKKEKHRWVDVNRTGNPCHLLPCPASNLQPPISNLQFPTFNLPNPALSPILIPLNQSLTRFMHPVHAWCIFEIWNMKYEIWNMRKWKWISEKWKNRSTGELIWIEPAMPTTSANIPPPTFNLQPPISWPITDDPSHITHHPYSYRSTNHSLALCTLLFYQISSWWNPHCSLLMYFWNMKYKKWT